MPQMPVWLGNLVPVPGRIGLASGPGEEAQLTIPLYAVSTFTTDFFRGNPAAVCLLEADEVRDDAWYQSVAAMLAQPATAFCQRSLSGFQLRWFSATHELALCGHGTLATAHVLYETGAVNRQDAAVLTTMSGQLTVGHDGERCWVTLPTAVLTEEPAPAEVLTALGVSSAQWYGRAAEDLVVVLDSAEEVEKVRPDFDLLLQLSTTRTVVTAAGGDGVDFTSRVFPPRIGISEDQVTGSAHAALGPYWAQRLGRQRLTARQASERGGELTLDLGGDGVVQVGGRALTTARGELLV
jgi:PhzF family phenazine biosynthesis protein